MNCRGANFGSTRLVLVASLIFCVVSPAGSEVVPPGLSVVRVLGVTEANQRAVASGVVIGRGLVATNCHTLRRSRDVRVYASRESVRATSQKVHAERDLCILSVPGLSAPTARIGASSQLHRSDPVLAMGYPGQRGLEVVRGVVEELFDYDGGYAIQTTASFTHGSSGGGLFDSDGTLVGILTFFRAAEGKDPSHFAIPIEWLSAALTLPSVPIAPISERPFWAREFESQPVFLQAGALEMAEMWTDLYELARDWSVREPHDPNAWRMLAKAAERTGRNAVAESAHIRSLQLRLSYP